VFKFKLEKIQLTFYPDTSTDLVKIFINIPNKFYIFNENFKNLKIKQLLKRIEGVDF
jgi:hypothetical protein